MAERDIRGELQAFQDRGWRLSPSSYQIRGLDGSPAGWVAQVHVFRDSYESLTITPLLEAEVKVYETAEAANRAAILMGYNWLVSNAS